jgi:hypothetical protein
MTGRVYQKIQISKREKEVIEFIQTGSDRFWEAYFLYTGRKIRMDRSSMTMATWFNSVLKGLHQKGIFKEIPFAHRMPDGKYLWANPGINASKANFECITIQEAVGETRYYVNKII